jgi:hypothetical protein
MKSAIEAYAAQRPGGGGAVTNRSTEAQTAADQAFCVHVTADREAVSARVIV